MCKLYKWFTNDNRGKRDRKKKRERRKEMKRERERCMDRERQVPASLKRDLQKGGVGLGSSFFV